MMEIDEVRLGYLSSSYQRFVEYNQRMYDYWWKDLVEPLGPLLEIKRTYQKVRVDYEELKKYNGPKPKPTYSLQRGDELFLHRFGGTVQCFPICYSTFFRGSLS